MQAPRETGQWPEQASGSVVMPPALLSTAIGINTAFGQRSLRRLNVGGNHIK
jgi:hypothetical protein